MLCIHLTHNLIATRIHFTYFCDDGVYLRTVLYTRCGIYEKGHKMKNKQNTNHFYNPIYFSQKKNLSLCNKVFIYVFFIFQWILFISFFFCFLIFSSFSYLFGLNITVYLQLKIVKYNNTFSFFFYIFYFFVFPFLYLCVFSVCFFHFVYVLHKLTI